MKRVSVLALVLLCSTAAPAQAGEFIFNCMNYWQQSVTVTVEAETEKEARNKLRTDREIRDKYSIDKVNLCAFRTEIKDKGKPKPKKSEEPVLPSE